MVIFQIVIGMVREWRLVLVMLYLTFMVCLIGLGVEKVSFKGMIYRIIERWNK